MRFTTKTLNQRTVDRGRRTAIRHPSSVIRPQGFTLIELVVAIGLLSIVLVFSGSIFKASIGSYRTASAQAEIMRKLRVITEQLDSDFQGLQKDGYLILRCEVISRQEYFNSSPGNFRADRIYYFCTGDFQSWFNSSIRSNIARIYFGHEGISIDPNNTNIFVSRWRLARDALLLTPGNSGGDFSDISYAWCKANPTVIVNDAGMMLAFPPDVITTNPNTFGRLLCENAGRMLIDWTDGSKDPNNAIAWFGFNIPRNTGAPGIPPEPLYDTIESYDYSLAIPYYTATWVPATQAILWPKAIRFTFTLYDSRGVFRGGQTFTHIVYLGD